MRKQIHFVEYVDFEMNEEEVVEVADGDDFG
jgi:hypothetical protein